MIRCKQHLKNKARHLRKNMTDSKRVLWSRLRSKQLYGIQVCRQRPIGEYIVDFFIPKAKSLKLILQAISRVYNIQTRFGGHC
jgi:very-short-patch-repair endonuclease